MTPLEETAAFQDVPIEIAVELDRRMIKIRDILEFQSGTVIAMKRSAGENLDIYMGKKLVASGELVVIENTMGVRITDFLTET